MHPDMTSRPHLPDLAELNGRRRSDQAFTFEAEMRHDVAHHRFLPSLMGKVNQTLAPSSRSRCVDRPYLTPSTSTPCFSASSCAASLAWRARDSPQPAGVRQLQRAGDAASL